MYETIAGGLAGAKWERQAARASGDRDRAARLELEIIDLNGLAAACADALALQRARFMHHGRLWPLAQLS